MNYDICKKLKDAGFPFKIDTTLVLIDFQEKKMSGFFFDPSGGMWILPTLEDLIDACGKTENSFSFGLIEKENGWSARIWIDNGVNKAGKCVAVQEKTPLEAVALLWLALNKKS